MDIKILRDRTSQSTDVGAECQHDMRPTVQLPGADSKRSLHKVLHCLVCTWCLSYPAHDPPATR